MNAVLTVGRRPVCLASVPPIQYPQHMLVRLLYFCGLSPTCTGSSALLVSGGDDGMLHAWSISALVALSVDTSANGSGGGASSMAVHGARSAVSTSGYQHPQPAPVLSVRIPSAPSQAAWGMGPTGNGIPGVTCAAADARSGRVVVGKQACGVSFPAAMPCTRPNSTNAYALTAAASKLARPAFICTQFGGGDWSRLMAVSW
jgi:hypothetical protein